jgi:hypothetical protein
VFEIKNQNGMIAYVEIPRYITASDNGSYIETDAEHANGIAINSAPYHITGTAELVGAVDDVLIRYVDTGTVVFNMKPYTETKTAYYGESEKVFYNVPQGNITVFFDNDYSVSRLDGTVTIRFEAVTENKDITIMIQ